MRAPDLTAQEQKHVRLALRYLRARLGQWIAVAKALNYSPPGLSNILIGARNVTPAMAFRIARLADVPIDDLLAGKYPASPACPHCGHLIDESADAQ
ncbi:MAG TPA: helix-turn-helix transcriptional regulator [Rudaea sp.]|nr:helix-turn-helix transcriptional regulator [Rudaea sp.]